MTYQEICRRLSCVYDVREAKAVARILIEELFSLGYADIICGGVEQLGAADEKRLDAALRRLTAGEPLQYVLGYADFAGLRFGVAPGVLIPRPETEWLVDRAEAIMGQGRDGASAMPHDGSEPRILDIGTGSGCIAVSVKRRLPQAYVEAWDISTDVLSIAKNNAGRLSVSVEFRQCDALKALAGGQSWNCIISNPPYVCLSESEAMERNVLEHEPHTALFVPDDDPLLFYRAIGGYAVKTLLPGGALLFECNTRYAQATADMLLNIGMEKATVVDDCFGKPRFVEARKAVGGYAEI